jgi:putative transposase
VGQTWRSDRAVLRSTTRPVRLVRRDRWAYLNRVETDFSRLGKPTDNAFIEVFNARLRADRWNASWFLSLADARQCIEEWKCHYEEERPHSALGDMSARAFAKQVQPARELA